MKVYLVDILVTRPIYYVIRVLLEQISFKTLSLQTCHNPVYYYTEYQNKNKSKSKKIFRDLKM